MTDSRKRWVPRLAFGLLAFAMWAFCSLLVFVLVLVLTPLVQGQTKCDPAFNAAADKWSKEHGGRNWFETVDWKGNGHYLVERGPDGLWRFTAIEGKTGHKPAAGVEETTDPADPKIPPTNIPEGKVKTTYIPPTIDPKGSVNFGVVPGELSSKPSYTINGRPANRDTVQAAMRDSADKVNDISAKNWLVLIGTPEQQRAALGQVTPAMSRELNVKGLTPDEVKAKGLAHESTPNDVTVYCTTPDGEVKHKQTGTDGLQDAMVRGGLLGPRYDPKKDPDLRVKIDHQIPFLDKLKLDGNAGYGLAAAVGAFLAWMFGRKPDPPAPQPSSVVVVPTQPPPPPAAVVPAAASSS